MKVLPAFGSIANARCIDGGNTNDIPAAPDKNADFFRKLLLVSIIKNIMNHEIRCSRDKAACGNSEITVN
jgi:hypothetical protein